MTVIVIAADIGELPDGYLDWWANRECGKRDFSIVDTFSGVECFAWCVDCCFIGPYRYPSIDGMNAAARDWMRHHGGTCPLCSTGYGPIPSDASVCGCCRAPLAGGAEVGT